MRVEIECLLIGLISAICCMISYKIVYGSIKSKYSNKNNYFYLNYPHLRNNVIFSFFIGALVHYIVKKSNLTDSYCKKVCYDDQCFMVCPI